MNKPDTICYFYLLQRQLGELNKLNLLLQRIDVIIPEVSDQIDLTYKNIASCIIKRNYLKFTPATKIKLSDAKQYLSYSDYELGESFRLYAIENGQYLKQFYKDSFNFTLALCLEMQIFFVHFEDPIFSSLSCLYPKHALSKGFHVEKKHLFESYMKIFENLIKGKEEAVRNQWDLLLNSDVKIPADIEINEFWFMISKKTDYFGNFLFADIAQIALVSLCVPHANADTERLFSDLNYVKSKLKTCLLSVTVDAILRVRQLLKSLKAIGEKFVPTQLMIELYFKRVYNEKKPVDQSNLINV